MLGYQAPRTAAAFFLPGARGTAGGGCATFPRPPVQVLTIPLPLALLAAGIPRGARRAFAAGVPQVRAAGS